LSRRRDIGGGAAVGLRGGLEGEKNLGRSKPCRSSPAQSPTTRAIQSLNRLALEAIHWRKPDRRPPHRPANAFVIAPIILVALLVT
jgi:hypothetical protein